METRAIGSLQATVVGLGCNNFGGRIDEAATKKVVSAALDAGITLFDTADIYGGTLSEEYLGRALGARRDEALVATKFGVPIDDEHKGGASAAYVASACEDSLRRLGTDRIDLYQLHFPDQATPHEETLTALDALVTAGKVREIGCSNFTPEMIDESARSKRRQRDRALRQRPERVLTVAARSREAGRARCVREARPRVHPVLPARQRRVVGQIRTGRGAGRRHAARGPARGPSGAGVVGRGDESRRGARRVERAITGTRCSSSHFRGCSRGRPSPA